MVPLVMTFGIDVASLMVTLLAVAALGLPLAMDEASHPINALPATRVLVTRRNLILALTCMVTVATWYATIGGSWEVLAALTLGLPVVLAASRVRHAGIAASRRCGDTRCAGNDGRICCRSPTSHCCAPSSA